MGRRRLADLREHVLTQGHSGRTDIANALRQLIIGHFFQSLSRRVAEILADATVEMNIHKARDHVAAGGVYGLIIPALACNHRTVCTQGSVHEPLF